MVHTLVLVLRGPLQAWGVRSRYNRRTTQPQPTKSGVAGLLASALGYARSADLSEFQELRFGTRTDIPGTLAVDFQTAKTLGPKPSSMPLTHRHMLEDAVFLVGFEAPNREQLEKYFEAVKAPAFPLYLGRRAFPPAGPVHTEICEGSLENVLKAYPWQASDYQAKRLRNLQRDGSERIHLTFESRPGDPTFATAETVADNPVSFSMEHRQYDFRAMTHDYVALEAITDSEGEPADPRDAHDPMALLVQADDEGVS